MKKIMIIAFAIIGIFFFDTFQAFSTTEVTFIIGNGGKMQWNGELGPNTNCKKSGNDCYIFVKKVQFNEISLGNDGFYYLHLTLTELQAEIGNQNNNFISALPTNNFEFPDGSTATIENSEEYPQYNGRILPLDNIITNNDGTFSIKL